MRCLIALGMALAGGCGGDEGAADAPVAIDAPVVIDATNPDATSPDAATGSITIRVNGVSGQVNKVVLVGVLNPGGGGFQGAVCQQVTLDPFSFVAVAQTPSPSNPCSLGAVTVFTDGTYDVSGGIYTPGSMTPDACSVTTVVVAGSGDVTMPAFGTCN